MSYNKLAFVISQLSSLKVPYITGIHDNNANHFMSKFTYTICMLQCKIYTSDSQHIC